MIFFPVRDHNSHNHNNKYKIDLPFDAKYLSAVQQVNNVNLNDWLAMQMTAAHIVHTTAHSKSA